MKHNQSKCINSGCILIPLTIIANIIVIGVLLFLAVTSYGNEKYIILLFLIPPVLSITTIAKMESKEDRMLKKRIKTARLRKELKDLSEFDKSE